MEYVDLARFVFSLLAVIALILLCVWIAKRLDVEKRLAGLRKNTYLSIVESFHVDPKHKLVIVKRGSIHHVLLIGQGTSLVVESYEVAPQETPNVAS